MIVVGISLSPNAETSLTVRMYVLQPECSITSKIVDGLNFSGIKWTNNIED